MSNPIDNTPDNVFIAVTEGQVVIGEVQEDAGTLLMMAVNVDLEGKATAVLCGDVKRGDTIAMLRDIVTKLEEAELANDEEGPRVLTVGIDQ